MAPAWRMRSRPIFQFHSVRELTAVRSYVDNVPAVERAEGVAPNPTVLRRRQDLEAFRVAYQELLGAIGQEHGRLSAQSGRDRTARLEATSGTSLSNCNITLDDIR